MNVISLFTKHVLDEIDMIIRDGILYGAYDLPIEFPNTEGEVKPIWSTYVEDEGLIFILQIMPSGGSPTYVSVTQGDGGMIISRSKTSDKAQSLKFKSREGWTKL